MFHDRHIIQAPMAGGITTPSLVSAVSNAGGIGSFGFAYSNAEKIDADLSEVKKHSTGPILANFFVFSDPIMPDSATIKAAEEALRAAAAGITEDIALPTPPYFPDLATQIAPIWDHIPEYLTFHFGVPNPAIIDQAKSLGIHIGITATSSDEVEAIEKAGADFIILQGEEAGGHRGTFTQDGPDDCLITLALLQMAQDITSLPLVTAGGIMTGKDIARHLSHGASAVQMGTAFLCCEEAGTNAVYRRYLLQKGKRKSRFTKGYSGRWARGIETDFIKDMASQPVLPFPLQNTMTGPMRNLATKAENGEYQSLWAGTGFAKCRDMAVADLMAELQDEMAP